jgi:predicted acyltransferase
MHSSAQKPLEVKPRHLDQTRESVPGPSSMTTGGRLVSLDAFRGFTMFWLMGGKAFVLSLATLVGFEFVRYQLTHSAWEGVRYYDLIWPSFMLMVGVSIPFSFARRSLTQTRGQLMRDAWKRAAILFLLGSLRESLSAGTPHWIELSSALQPIAIAYLVTSYLAGRSIKLQISAAVGILAGYALLLAFVGTATVPAGSYEKNHNLVTAVDELVLGRSHRDGWGTLISMIPTIALLARQPVRHPERHRHQGHLLTMFNHHQVPAKS